MTARRTLLALSLLAGIGLSSSAPARADHERATVIYHVGGHDRDYQAHGWRRVPDHHRYWGADTATTSAMRIAGGNAAVTVGTAVIAISIATYRTITSISNMAAERSSRPVSAETGRRARAPGCDLSAVLAQRAGFALLGEQSHCLRFMARINQPVTEVGITRRFGAQFPGARFGLPVFIEHVDGLEGFIAEDLVDEIGHG